MKIGILTFHHTTNYGATLQSYALQRYLIQLSHEVELIDYRPYKAVWHYVKEMLPIRRKGANITEWVNTVFIQYILKAQNMRNFSKNYTQLSPQRFYQKSDLDQYNHQYDAVIIGSDQVWCINSVRGFDSSYFLDFVNGQNCSKLSYAASCGPTRSWGKYEAQIRTLLQDFHALGIRDTNSIELVNASLESKKKITKVLDPTFLVNYEDIMVVPKRSSDYVLIYSHHGMVNPLSKELIQLVNQRLNTSTVISVGHPSKIANKNLVGIGPQEWLGYIYHAPYVITNCYHGVIFSIIFQKQFSFIPYGNTNNKAMDILETFNLTSRILSDKYNANALEKQSASIDYTSINEKREKLLHQSQSYLKKGLEKLISISSTYST